MRNNAAKVRRLYDIANVLSSLKLIEKTQNSESRKPAFRWLGIEGKSTHAATVPLAPIAKQWNKRAFGTDVTNTDLKKSKSIPSVEGKQRKVIRSRSEDLKECNLTAQRQLQGSKGHAFGPFCPISVAKGEHEANGADEEKALLDWEAMAASFHPQYHNQALSELFAHYMEAWKSWYVELAQDSNSLELLK
ncbi:unnamed protein product [Spirodela intermedia]|uniref:E2F/DP family winged-helix DNA-binding domain-containing protein n=1 Tax=Spirodela intermedia TaxID=51605 RepID=A0A7I8JR19_SPIIN|nr:unnamed protein product [Spirodela intermedia]CAA6672596.1 unnamed protein product [Spirodela intermedia]